ncbi:ribulose-phosphate 3-epimerase [Candidatus Woesearchaeota archaeon]|nr:ribulose-phosphate 3-epimerase [Candidatus Woesearchaeota archaeon]
MPKIKIAPSILSAKKEKLQEEVNEIEPVADLIHVDIMDGKFVPPKTFKAEEIKAVSSKLPKDVHLMVKHPIKDGFIEDYADAGAKIITIHEECKDDIKEAFELIRSKGIKVGISINPPTPLDKIKQYIDDVGMVLIMSVNPGYPGQKFIPDVLPKVEELRKLKPELDIEIDGGINEETIGKAAKAGANVFVAGSAIFGKEDRVGTIKKLREAAND